MNAGSERTEVLTGLQVASAMRRLTLPVYEALTGCAAHFRESLPRLQFVIALLVLPWAFRWPTCPTVTAAAAVPGLSSLSYAGQRQGLRAIAAPSAASLNDLVQAIDAHYHDTRTLKAEFTQTYVWGDTTRKESGTAYFARGGLMRWEYREPKNKLVVADGRKMWLYIPEEKQVTQSPFKAENDPRVPFPLLLSRFDIRKVFSKIEPADQALKAAPGDRVLRGYPRHGNEDLYSQVLIEVNPKYDIKRLVVFYPDHSAMEFAFEHMERNLVLPSSLFTFSPPAGSEVIEE